MVKLNVLAALTLAAAATPALSTIVITSPVASTTGRGDKRLTVEWNDDGKDPKLSSDWGNLNIYLATGSRDVQYKLQTLDSNVSPSETRGRYKIDEDAGPDGGYYFIRIEGSKTDAKGIPPMAFSARFTLEDMKGQFNSTIKAELSGAGGTASPGGGASPTGVSTLRMTSSTSAPTTRPTTSNPVANAASTTSNPVANAASTTGNTSDAASVRVAGFATALVTVAAIGATFF